MKKFLVIFFVGLVCSNTSFAQSAQACDCSGEKKDCKCSDCDGECSKCGSSLIGSTSLRANLALGCSCDQGSKAEDKENTTTP